VRRAGKSHSSNTLERQLCEIAESGGIEGDWEAYVTRVKAPRFVCRKCGRVAGEAGLLCDPERL